jgi:nucleotide-binding universal stress UspA family protein
MTIDSSGPTGGGGPTPDPGIVRAFAPPGSGRHAVVAWARRHARRTGARIEILVDPDLAAPPDRPADAHAGPIALVGALLGHVWALFVDPGSLTERLGRASAGARLFVVPQSLPEVDVLVDTAYEPVTVVPTDPPHPYGAVVLALAHRTTEETIGAAFDAAEQRGAPVHVLRLRDPARWTVVTTEDAAARADEERRDCADRLSAWRITHPSVPVEVRVGEGDVTVELIGATCEARLLVVGRSARGRLLGTVTPSPVARTVRRARCPVLVVPPPGPPRRSWWPRARPLPLGTFGPGARDEA